MSIFDKENLSARDRVDEWVSVKKMEGDNVEGKFMGWWINPGQPGFKDQIAVALEQADGKVFATSINDTSFMRVHCETSQIGDMVGLRFEGTKESGKPSPTKIIRFYNADRKQREAEGTQATMPVTKAEVGTDKPSVADGEELDF